MLLSDIIFNWHETTIMASDLGNYISALIFRGYLSSKLSFREVNRRFYGREFHFMATLTCRRKTEFVTIKLMVYLPI